MLDPHQLVHISLELRVLGHTFPSPLPLLSPGIFSLQFFLILALRNITCVLSSHLSWLLTCPEAHKCAFLVFCSIASHACSHIFRGTQTLWISTGFKPFPSNNSQKVLSATKTKTKPTNMKTFPVFTLKSVTSPLYPQIKLSTYCIFLVILPNWLFFFPLFCFNKNTFLNIHSGLNWNTFFFSIQLMNQKINQDSSHSLAHQCLWYADILPLRAERQ